MNKKKILYGRKKIVVASTFSSMDLFLLGFVQYGLIPGFAVERSFWAAMMHAANFKHKDGIPLVEFINISQEEYDWRRSKEANKEDSELKHTVGKLDGQPVRPKEVEDYTGADIRAAIEREHGKDVIIILIGGPPCQDITPLNRRKRVGAANRNRLLYEFLRFVRELRPDVAVMEESAALSPTGEFKELYFQFIEELKKLPYYSADMVMNSLHYGSNQSRDRTIFILVDQKIGVQPVFPIGDDKNCKRVKDFLPIDYFHSGHFIDKVKNKYNFMCTVTSGSPLWFSENGVKRAPRIDELLLCMDVYNGDYIIPQGVPVGRIKKGIGNGVCVTLARALAKTVVEEILQMKPCGDGWWTDNEDYDGSVPVMQAPVKPKVSPDKGPIQPSVGSTPDPNGKNIAPANVSGRSNRIIDSFTLLGMQFPEIKFRGEWQGFIGNPSKNFLMVVHGLAGHGKSTFCVQFAKYLAENHGPVLYNSGEEGFSKTLRDKMCITDAINSNLHWSEFDSAAKMKTGVPADKFSFIFIDSVNNMKIGADELRDLRRHFKNTAFIAICQATKAGAMRGSYEIVHDGDVTVKVEEGYAVTTKNRFNRTDLGYSVFGHLGTVGAESDSMEQTSTAETVLNKLEEDLRRAIQDEDYEQAARIRDKIDSIRKSTGSGDDRGSESL